MAQIYPAVLCLIHRHLVWIKWEKCITSSKLLHWESLCEQAPGSHSESDAVWFLYEKRSSQCLFGAPSTTSVTQQLLWNCASSVWCWEMNVHVKSTVDVSENLKSLWTKTEHLAFSERKCLRDRFIKSARYVMCNFLALDRKYVCMFYYILKQFLMQPFLSHVHF